MEEQVFRNKFLLIQLKSRYRIRGYKTIKLRRYNTKATIMKILSADQKFTSKPLVVRTTFRG